MFANSFPFYYFYVMLRRITGQLTLFKYKIDIERTFEALFACFLQFFSFVSCLKYIFLIPRRSNLGIQLIATHFGLKSWKLKTKTSRCFTHAIIDSNIFFLLLLYKSSFLSAPSLSIALLFYFLYSKSITEPFQSS